MPLYYGPFKGRSATYIIAASDAPAHVKAQADEVCTGVNDNIKIQAAIDAMSTWNGKIVLMGGNFHLGETGIIFTGFDKSFVSYGKIFYSGIGDAVTIENPIGHGSSINLTVDIASIEAEGAAIASATAVAIKLHKSRSTWLKVNIESFRAGTGIKMVSDLVGNNENSWIWALLRGVKVGIVEDYGYKTIAYLDYENNVEGSIALDLASSGMLVSGLHVGYLYTVIFGGTTGIYVKANGVSDTMIDTWVVETYGAGVSAILLDVSHADSRIKVRNLQQIPSGGATHYVRGYIKDTFIEGVLSGPNLVSNPNFENSVSGWGAWNATLTWEAAIGHTKVGSASVIQTGAAAVEFLCNTDQIPLVGGERYGFSSWTQSAVAGATMLPMLATWDKDDVFLGYAIPVSPALKIDTVDTWFPMSGVFAVPALAVRGRLDLQISMPNNADKFYIDEIVLSGPSTRIHLQNSGTAVGTGAQQLVAHGLAATPTRQQIALFAGSATANPFHSADPDGTNIKVTAVAGQPWYWATAGA